MTTLAGPSGPLDTVRRSTSSGSSAASSAPSAVATPDPQPLWPVKEADAMLQHFTNRYLHDGLPDAFNLANMIQLFLEEVTDLPDPRSRSLYTRRILHRVFKHLQDLEQLDLKATTIAVVSKDGRGLLHDALKASDFMTVIYLIKHGADPMLDATMPGDDKSFWKALDGMKPKSDHYRNFRLACSWVDLAMFIRNHNTYDSSFYITTPKTRFRLRAERLMRDDDTWLRPALIKKARRIWIHVPCNNGSMTWALLQTLHKHRDQDLWSPPDLARLIDEDIKAPTVTPGNPSLKYWPAKYCSNEYKSSSKQPSLYHRSIVFPYFRVTAFDDHLHIRGRYEDVLNNLATRPSSRHSNYCIFHTVRTLDETYYPGLDVTESEQRNKDQVISKVYQSVYRACLEEKSPSFNKYPLIMVPQLWLWQIGKTVVSAHSDGPSSSFRTSSSPKHVDVSPELQMGIMMAERINQFGEGFELDDNRMSPPLAMFESHMVSILSDVNSYIRNTAPSKIAYNKEKRILQNLFDITAELVMIGDVLERQREILEQLLEDRMFLPSKFENADSDDDNDNEYDESYDIEDEAVEGKTERTKNSAQMIGSDSNDLYSVSPAASLSALYDTSQRKGKGVERDTSFPGLSEDSKQADNTRRNLSAVAGATQPESPHSHHSTHSSVPSSRERTTFTARPARSSRWRRSDTFRSLSEDRDAFILRRPRFSRWQQRNTSRSPSIDRDAFIPRRSRSSRWQQPNTSRSPSIDRDAFTSRRFRSSRRRPLETSRSRSRSVSDPARSGTESPPISRASRDPTMSRKISRPWRSVEEALLRLKEYQQRVTKIREDAGRVETAVQDQLELRKTYASVKDAHNSLILSAAVIGFTVITIIFAPLAFLTALFAMKMDSFHRLRRNATDPDGEFKSGLIAAIFSMSELITWIITGVAVAYAVSRIRQDDQSDKEDDSETSKPKPSFWQTLMASGSELVSPEMKGEVKDDHAVEKHDHTGRASSKARRFFESIAAWEARTVDVTRSRMTEPWKRAEAAEVPVEKGPSQSPWRRLPRKRTQPVEGDFGV